MPIESRRYRLLLAYAIGALPLVVFGAWRSLALNANSPLEWVSENFPARRDYEQFRRHFGGGDVIVVSWQGCTAGDPRLDQLADLLRRSTTFLDAEGRWYFERVVTGPEVLLRLSAGPLGLARDEALRRLRGSFFGKDGTTCAIITFSGRGLVERKRIVASLRALLSDTCHVPEEQQHLAGPVMDGLAVDLASTSSLNRFAPLSAVVIFLVCWWALRSLRVAALIFGLSLYCMAAALALIHYCGDTMNALLIVMPPLIQVLAVSGGIHLANYFFDALKQRGQRGAGREALARGWLPCSLSAGTTSVALASLLVSDLVPVRAFGAYAAAGVAFTAVFALGFIPGTLERWSSKLVRHGHRSAGNDEDSWWPLAEFICRHHWAIVACTVLLMVLSSLGVQRLGTSVRIRTLFPPTSRILRDYAWLERELGPLVPIEVVVRFDKTCTLPTAQRLALVSKMQRNLGQIDGVEATFSAASILPPSTAGSDGGPSPEARAMQQRFFGAAQRTLIDMQYLEASASEERWRLTARVSALSDMDYARFLGVVRNRVNGLLHTEDGGALQGVATRCSGIMPLVHAIQGALMRNLFASFVAAFAIIAAVMTVAQGGMWAGLLAMVPNLFPAVVVFGLLGWLRIPMDIGTVMTASVALGIAVDDTLHFLGSFRGGIDAGLTPRESVYEAYRRCGVAMVQTTVICGWGMLAFGLSSFVPTSRFALLLVGSLVLALLGDLILLPALLIGPFGRAFGPSASGAEFTGPMKRPAEQLTETQHAGKKA